MEVRSVGGFTNCEKPHDARDEASRTARFVSNILNLEMLNGSAFVIEEGRKAQLKVLPTRIEVVPKVSHSLLPTTPTASSINAGSSYQPAKAELEPKDNDASESAAGVVAVKCESAGN